MLQNAYLLAKIGADTAENERNVANILPKNGNYRTGPLGRGLQWARSMEREPDVQNAHEERRQARARDG